MIAIIPTEEWREALLGNGPCGSRAPRIGHDLDHSWLPIPAAWSAYRAFTWSAYKNRTLALPLLWKGEPVPDGIAGAVRALVSADSEDDALVNDWMHAECHIMDHWAVDGWRTIDLLAARLTFYGIAADVVTND